MNFSKKNHEHIKSNRIVVSKTVKLLTICFFATHGMFLNAQNDDFICIANHDYIDPAGVYSYSTTFDNSFSTNPPMVFNIKFWDLRDDDGSTYTIITETDALEATANLNMAYNEFNIFFKYRAFEHVNDSIAYHQGGLPGMRDRLIDLGYETLSSMNVILSDQTDIGTGFTPGIYCQVPKATVTGWVTIHEIGHNFLLRHPFYRFDATNCTACEHVTRNPDDIENPNDDCEPFFNAKTKGDYLVDTAAISITSPDENYDYNSCDYTVNGKDCQDTPYDLQTVDLYNYMNANVPNGEYRCRTMFSPGQGVRMRETILDRPNTFNPVKATVPDLFEPYDGEYTTSGGSLTGIKFQPGFDYDFLNCYPNGGYPLPSNYTDITFTYTENGLWNYSFPKDIAPNGFNSIIHKDRFAVRIQQLDDVQPRKCWNTGQGAVGGTLMLFNDGVLNENVTITPQDSTAINNPLLIENLPAGLYNIIKNYESSGTDENLILKQEN